MYMYIYYRWLFLCDVVQSTVSALTDGDLISRAQLLIYAARRSQEFFILYII